MNSMAGVTLSIRPEPRAIPQLKARRSYSQPRAQTHFRWMGLALAVLFHAGIFSLLNVISFAHVAANSSAVVLPPCEFNVIETQPYVDTPPFLLPVPKMLTEKPLDISVPALDIPLAEPAATLTLNGFLDVEDGGTAANDLTPRSGGGGGDGNDAALETGHIGEMGRLSWKAHPKQNQYSAGTLSSPGAGDGLGSGTGSGASLSTGSGNGFGAGMNGSGARNGTGKAAPGGITREPEALAVFGGEYPHAARRAQREGVVKLRIEVLTNGHVGEIALEQSSGSGDLDQAAFQAARYWSFKPAISDGNAVVSWVTVPVKYVLANR